MAYSAPVLTPSGTTWAQLQALGAQGLVQKIAAVNHCNADIVSRLAGSKTIAATFAGYVTMVERYLAGDPVEATDFQARLLNVATVFRALASTCDEINTLINANPGTIKTVPQIGSIHPVKMRAFP